MSQEEPPIFTLFDAIADILKQRLPELDEDQLGKLVADTCLAVEEWFTGEREQPVHELLLKVFDETDAHINEHQKQMLMMQISAEMARTLTKAIEDIKKQ